VKKARAGFTLLELLVVIAIIGTLSAVGISNLPRDKIQVREATRVITADINRARSEAIRLNTKLGLTFDLANDRYTLYRDDEPEDWAPDDGANILERRISNDFPLVDLTSASFSSGPNIRFDVRGLPNWPGTITVASRGRSDASLDIVMEIQGRLRIEEVP
jgi:prepilin-type N-terminal cleavage/methylation domain-containing protein